MLEVRQVDEDPGVQLLQLELHLAVLERVVAVPSHPLRAAVQVPVLGLHTLRLRSQHRSWNNPDHSDPDH